LNRVAITARDDAWPVLDNAAQNKQSFARKKNGFACQAIAASCKQAKAETNIEACLATNVEELIFECGHTKYNHRLATKMIW
jgi:hypothetical protein